MSSTSSDGKKKAGNKTLELTNLSCARCSFRFTLIDMRKMAEFRCPKCKARHIKVKIGRDKKAQWYDEKILELMKERQ